MPDALEQQIGALVVRLIREVFTLVPPEGYSAENATVQFNMSPECGIPGRWEIQVRQLTDGDANG